MQKVFVNGTFDILHIGHLSLLQYARQQGDWLLVGIDSDRRVRELKGSSRPINTQHERQAMLQALRVVDQVQIFDTDQELRSLIASCDVMVKGTDYQNQPIVGADLCPILFFPRINDYSTTQKIQHIVDRR